jgi:nitroreductase
MNKTFETLITAAARAPSGDNTQPWRFVADPEARRIAVHVEETCDPSPMNSGQRMSRMAVGAALENLLRAARSKGWRTELEEPRDRALALVRLCDFAGDEGEVDPAIAARVTNRRSYDARPVPPEVLAELRRQTPQLDGVRTHWIHQRDRIDSWASLVGRADALMFGEPSMRRAFLKNIRFDAPWDAEVEEGLPLASLELSAADRVGLRMMARIPDWLFKAAGVKRKFCATARKLVASASGLCLVVEEHGTPQSEVLAGRAAQRAWLALTTQGLAAQPMMSLIVLDNALHHGSAELIASLGQEKLEEMRQTTCSLLPELGDARAAFLLRFGYADPPSGRTGRLPRAASVSEVSGAHVASKQPLLR